MQPAKTELARLDGTILADKTSDKLKLVADITGLDFGRFTKSMLLAQGGFAAFLNADANARAELLEELEAQGFALAPGDLGENMLTGEIEVAIVFGLATIGPAIVGSMAIGDVYVTATLLLVLGATLIIGNIIRPAAFRRRSEAKLRPRSEAHLDEVSEVDRILEKMSREGTHSLTQAERDVLIKASERQKR